MAKKKPCCEDFHKWFGVGVLLAGLWYLLVDLGYVRTLGVNWWTLVFLLAGAKMVYHHWFA